MEEEQLKLVDAHDLTPRELNRLLKDSAKRYRKIVVENPGGKHYVAAGLIDDVELEIVGSVGYFVGTMAEGPRITVHGNVGWFAGDNMTSGKLLVEGHAGNGPGQGIYGGLIFIKGDAGDRIGSLMKGGRIVIGGSTGIMTGLYMMGGEIVVLGKLGEYAGESVIGGRIYFAGPEPSLGKNAKVVEVEEGEEEFLRGLLMEGGLEPPYPKLRKIVPESPRPFYKKSSALRVRLVRSRVGIRFK